MLDCIVTTADFDAGHYQEWRGLHEPVRALSPNPDTDGLTPRDVTRGVSTWVCSKADVPIVVAKMSEEWVGHEIKIFNLTQVSTRMLGETKSKQVSKDGILPV